MSRQAKRGTPWIRVEDYVRAGQLFTCQRCGKTRDLPMPYAMNLYAMTLEKFEQEHKQCEVPA